MTVLQDRPARRAQLDLRELGPRVRPAQLDRPVPLVQRELPVLPEVLVQRDPRGHLEQLDPLVPG